MERENLGSEVQEKNAAFHTLSAEMLAAAAGRHELTQIPTSTEELPRTGVVYVQDPDLQLRPYDVTKPSPPGYVFRYAEDGTPAPYWLDTTALDGNAALADLPPRQTQERLNHLQHIDVPAADIPRLRFMSPFVAAPDDVPDTIGSNDQVRFTVGPREYVILSPVAVDTLPWDTLLFNIATFSSTQEPKAKPKKERFDQRKDTDPRYDQFSLDASPYAQERIAAYAEEGMLTGDALREKLRTKEDSLRRTAQESAQRIRRLDATLFSALPNDTTLISLHPSALNEQLTKQEAVTQFGEAAYDYCVQALAPGKNTLEDSRLAPPLDSFRLVADLGPNTLPDALDASLTSKNGAHVVHRTFTEILAIDENDIERLGQMSSMAIRPDDLPAGFTPSAAIHVVVNRAYRHNRTHNGRNAFLPTEMLLLSPTDLQALQNHARERNTRLVVFDVSRSRDRDIRTGDLVPHQDVTPRISETRAAHQAQMLQLAKAITAIDNETVRAVIQPLIQKEKSESLDDMFDEPTKPISEAEHLVAVFESKNKQKLHRLLHKIYQAVPEDQKEPINLLLKTCRQTDHQYKKTLLQQRCAEQITQAEIAAGQAALTAKRNAYFEACTRDGKLHGEALQTKLVAAIEEFDQEDNDTTTLAGYIAKKTTTERQFNSTALPDTRIVSRLLTACLAAEAGIDFNRLAQMHPMLVAENDLPPEFDPHTGIPIEVNTHTGRVNHASFDARQRQDLGLPPVALENPDAFQPQLFYFVPPTVMEQVAAGATLFNIDHSFTGTPLATKE